MDYRDFTIDYTHFISPFYIVRNALRILDFCNSQTKYHIAGKCGGNNVWQKLMDKPCGEKSLAHEQIGQNIINCNYQFGRLQFGKLLMIYQICQTFTPQTFSLYISLQLLKGCIPQSSGDASEIQYRIKYQSSSLNITKILLLYLDDMNYLKGKHCYSQYSIHLHTMQ